MEAREGYTAQQKQRNLLSELTMEGIQITGMFILCIQLILLASTNIFYSVIICRVCTINSESTRCDLFSK